MPIFDGIEVYKGIRNQSPHTRIAMMTGCGADIATELLNDETTNYLFRKPFVISYVCEFLIPEARMADQSA